MEMSTRTTPAQTGTPARRRLEAAIAHVSNEFHDEAAWLANFAHVLRKELNRSQQLRLLLKLTRLAHELDRTTRRICRWCDQNQGRS
jgi:hypothetical protein